MFSISRNVSPEVLNSAGIELVIVSNGSFEMIKSYRKIFRTPFAVYTDPTHQVYNALGMTLQTLDKGPRGDYVRHGLISGIGMVVANAVKVGMPVWKEGGDISQLGGEFILGPGLTCSWVHRMKYTRSHVPILHVIEAAGVDMYTPLHRAASSTGGSFLGMSSEEESKWMERRRKALNKLRGKKMSRRGGTQWIDTASITTASNSPQSSKRSSVSSEATGSLCSWDPSTEEAINVGLMGYEAAIIEEAEEEPHSVPNEASMGIIGDTKSEFGDDSESFISRDDSELEMTSATDVSAVDGQSVVNVTFDKVKVRFDSKIDEGEVRTVSDRSSYSSIGSGYDAVVEYHGVFFANAGEKMCLNPAASMSDSSLGTVDG
ncbi:hypothetical protein B0H11DRAFT_2001501 [Mycena galericulata]|nr:hypothetical protein B0H11DRAFT_2001501 [Mycena galericulata]